MVAHTTQFAQPGWHFADGGGCTLLADKQGSAVSYISPSGKDISIVIETAQSNVTNTIEIKLTGGFVQLKQLHVWRSIPGAVFVELAPLTLTGGAGSLTVPAGGGGDSHINHRSEQRRPGQDDTAEEELHAALQ
jgi:hypothetical protein